jgi:hypothetical protein
MIVFAFYSPTIHAHEPVVKREIERAYDKTTARPFKDVKVGDHPGDSHRASRNFVVQRNASGLTAKCG